MLRILIIMLILVAGIIVGPLIADHQGLVMFQSSGYRVKMSFTTFILCQVLLLLVIFIVYWLLRTIFYSKTTLGSWLRSKSPRKAVKRIEQAQLLLLEGDYKKAASLLSRGAKSAKNSVLTYLQAAQADIHNNRFSSAKEHLDEAAQRCQNKEKFAFKLVQLRLHLKSKQYDAAKLAVEALLEEKSRNPEVLRLADELYYKTKDYQAIIELLPAMYKSEAFNEDELDQFKNVAYISRIKQLADLTGVEDMMKWWNKQPKKIRNNPIYQETVTLCRDGLLTSHKTD